MSDFDRNINDRRNPWDTWRRKGRRYFHHYNPDNPVYANAGFFFPDRSISWNEPLYPDDHGVVTEHRHLGRAKWSKAEYGSHWGQRLWYTYASQNPKWILEQWIGLDWAQHWFERLSSIEALLWFQLAGFKSVKLQIGSKVHNFQVVDDRMFDKSQAMHWVDLGSSLYLSASHRWFLQTHDFNDHRGNDTWFQLDYGEASHWFDLAGLTNTIAVPADWYDPTQRQET